MPITIKRAPVLISIIPLLRALSSPFQRFKNRNQSDLYSINPNKIIKTPKINITNKLLFNGTLDYVTIDYGWGRVKREK